MKIRLVLEEMLQLRVQIELGKALAHDLAFLKKCLLLRTNLVCYYYPIHYFILIQLYTNSMVENTLELFLIFILLGNIIPNLGKNLP